MFKLNDADFEKVWELIRKNKFRLAFQYGSLMWGMPSYIFGLVFTTVAWDDMPITFQKMIIGVIAFLMMGYIMGLLIYNKNEKRFNKLISGNS
jgi:ABC-type dipeptide/oligopeptide/nickel transport system permease component